MGQKKHTRSLRWGILGCGHIAGKFAQDLRLAKGNKLYAAGSRSVQKAQTFCKKFKVKHAYGSYEALLQDPKVDIIYIATPHNSHLEYGLASMNAGKHVLIEKPIAINKHQVRKLIQASKRNNVFMMEALWTRFIPSVKKLLTLIEKDRIGPVNWVSSAFSFSRNDDPKSRMLNMDLAGGSLLDQGIYNAFLAYLLMGKPEKVLAKALFHDQGADVQTSAILTYEKGFANLYSGFDCDADMKAAIHGPDGRIELDPIWFKAEGFSLIKKGKTKKYKLPIKGFGYYYEIKECAKCIRNGWIESKQWTHQNSLDLISITDTIRQRAGIKYPFE